jgi:hypothetical protein
VRVCLECFADIEQNKKVSQAKDWKVKFWQLDIFGNQTPAT